jgi:integrase
MKTQYFNLTKTFIHEAQCPDGKDQIIYRDSKREGLGLRVTKSGGKSFIFETWINNQTQRLTIGDIRTWSIPQAQIEARSLKVLSDQRVDIRAQRAKQKSEAIAQSFKGVTGLFAWNEYVLARKHKWGVRHLSDHLDMVRDGGGLIKQGLRKGQSNIKSEGILKKLLSQPIKEMSREKVYLWLKSEVDIRPARVRIALSALKAFFTWMGDQNEYKSLIQVDSCNRLTKELPPKRAKNDCLQKEQLKIWFEGVNRIQNKVIKSYLQILLLTGTRRNELAIMKWIDLDLVWHTATIRDKVDGTRQISITPYMVKLFEDLPKVNEYVFSSEKAKLGHITEPTKAHQIVIQKAGLPHLSIHGIRRSFGTLAEWVECPEGMTHQIMGHKPSGIAEKHYRRRPIDLLRKWHTKIEKFILDEAGIDQPKWDELKQKPLISDSILLSSQ